VKFTYFYFKGKVVKRLFEQNVFRCPLKVARYSFNPGASPHRAELLDLLTHLSTYSLSAAKYIALAKVPLRGFVGMNASKQHHQPSRTSWHRHQTELA